MKRPPKTPFALDGVVTLTAAAGTSKRPTFEASAYNGGPLNVNAYPYPVTVDLAGLRSQQKIAVLLDHDRQAIVGQSKSVTMTTRTIKVAGGITGNLVEEGPTKTVLDHAAAGFEWPVSIGVDPEKVEFVASGESAKANGLNVSGPAYIVRRGRLGEMSFVSVGADENAAARIAAAAARGTNMRRNPTPQNDDLHDDETDAPVTADPVAGERQRVALIRSYADGFPDLQAEAISGGWTPEQTSAYALERIRAARPQIPNMMPRSAAPTLDQKTLTAAALLGLFSGQRETVAKQFDERTAQQAEDFCKVNRGLREFCKAALAANGVAGHINDPVEAAFSGRAVQASAMSIIDVPTLLSDAASKIALAAFRPELASWRPFTQVKPLKDFKVTKAIRLTGKGQWETTSPSGELKHGSLAEDVYSLQAGTKGQILVVSRTDLINDDLSALQGMATELGLGGRRAVDDSSYNCLLSNTGSFFSGTHKNVLTGSGSVLSVDQLVLAISALRKAVDADGHALGLSPKCLIVPPELEGTAHSILTSRWSWPADSTSADPASGTMVPTDLTLVVESRLSLAAYNNYSLTGWYLAAAAESGAPTLLIGYVGGVESPTIETAPADFNRLGFAVRGFLDYGVSYGDYRGCVWANGTT